MPTYRMPGRIIKAPSVRLTGGRRLLGEPPGGAAAPPGARIVQQGESGAVIEVTCGCGQRTLVQCDFAAERQCQERPQEGPQNGVKR